VTRVAWLVFKHEGRVLLADRTLWVVSAVFLALVGYGLFNGLAQARIKNEALATVLASQETREAARRETFRRVMAGAEQPDPFANPIDPASMAGGYGAGYAYMPISPLAPLAFGQSDLLPDYYRVTNASKVTFMYDTEIENPWNLLTGHFDLSFVVVYLVPLLIFGLSYNFLSSEREQGTLRLLMSQPVSLSGIVAGKILVRVAVIFVCAVIIPVAALAVLHPGIRAAAYWPSIAWWAGLVAAYSAFWFALAIAVNATGRSSAASALILIGSWVVLVLVAPVVLNLVVSMASPAPSRVELATLTRLVTIDGLNRYAELLATDYDYADNAAVLMPVDGKIEVPARRQGMYLVERDVDRKLNSILATFRAQLARQQQLVSWFGGLSPAITAYEGLTALAGTGVRRHLHFEQQVDDFHREWKEFFEPRMLNGIAITATDFDRIPRFTWREEDPNVVRGGSVGGVLQLLIPAIALGLVGSYRLRRFIVA
jgi:ABC-2 type transport system permease protein